MGKEVTPRHRSGHTSMSGASRLWEAAERGDASAVQLELDGGVPVDVAGRTQWTALHRSADRGWINVLRVLLSNGANPGRTTETGRDTPLHLAAARGHADIARELLKGGADFRVRARNGWTPLHSATFHNHADVQRVLIRAGADPIEKTERGSTTRTLSEGGSAKWQRDTSAVSTSSRGELSGYGGGDSSSVSQLSLGGFSARPGSPGRSGARSPGRDRIDDVVAAREQALWSLREKRQVERERERIDGAEAELQQHISHQQRRDEKRRLLEASLDVRVSTHSRASCSGTHACQPAAWFTYLTAWLLSHAWSWFRLVCVLTGRYVCLCV